MQNFQNFIRGSEISSEYGEFYLCQRRPDEFLTGWDFVKRDFLDRFKSPDETLNPEFRRAFQAKPSQILFLDIETTSLSPNSPLFLVGLLYLKGGSFRIDQLFARDYSEELPLILYLCQFLNDFKVLITFNGKAFDMSYIGNRANFHRLPFSCRCFHLDLLLHARRSWRRQLPNCKLQTLEFYLCHRRRIDDIPSALIPEAYHEFVRSGDFAILREVFYHNALDLITMMDLSSKLFLA